MPSALILLFFFGFFVALAENQKCKMADKACILRLANIVYEKVFEEDEALNHLLVEKAERDFPDLTADLTNTTINGYKSCKIVDLSWENNTVSQLEFYCIKFYVEGQYDIIGNLFNKKIEGKGDYILDTKTYKLLINIKAELIENNGITHLHLTDYCYSDLKALEKVKLTFTNLYHDGEEATDELRKIAREHWRDVLIIFENLLANISFGSIFLSLDKLLSKVNYGDYVEIQ